MKDRYRRVSDPKLSGLTAYHLKDSITLYNYVVRHYNDPCNQVDNTLLEECYCDSFYRFWYNKLRRWYLFVMLLYFAPYFTVLTLCFSLYCLIVHENAIWVSARNKKAVADPFVNMVSHDEICYRGKSHNLYFNVMSENLEAFPFSQSVKDLLRSREQEGVITFMVYDRHFRTQMEGLRPPRVLIWVHLTANLVLFVGMQLLIYNPYLCFNIFHPLKSVSECGQEALENFASFFWVVKSLLGLT